MPRNTLCVNVPETKIKDEALRENVKILNAEFMLCTIATVWNTLDAYSNI